MADIKQAIEAAKQDPNSAFATELRKRIESGKFNKELEAAGLPINVSKAPLGQRIKADFQTRTTKASEAQNRSIEGEQSLGSGALQTVGQGAGFVGDVLLEGIKTVIPNKVEDVITKGAEKVAQTKAAQDIAGRYQEWATENPEAAANLEASVNIASIIPVSKGVTAVTEGVGKGAVKATKATGKAVGDAVESTTKLYRQTADAVSGKAAKENQHLAAITPSTKDLAPGEYEKLLKQGRIAPKSGSSPDKYILSPAEISTAEKYKTILGKDSVKNTENLFNEISKKDKEVGEFLKKNNGIFNKGELKNYLTKQLEDIDDLTIDEKRIKKLKASTVDNFVKGLDKNDMENLWINRKEFDRTIEKAFSGSPTLQKEVKKGLRNAVQDFIAERTPDSVYKTTMKEMSQLFNLADTTASKAAKERGMNAIQAWIKKNPTKAKAIGWTAGTGIVGSIGASLLKN